MNADNAHRITSRATQGRRSFVQPEPIARSPPRDGLPHQRRTKETHHAQDHPRPRGIAAIATPLAFATSANAATTDANGVVTVTKGDIQTAMGWNNTAWDDEHRHSRRGHRPRRQDHHQRRHRHPGRRSGRLAHPERADRRQLPGRRVLLRLVDQPGELGSEQHPRLLLLGGQRRPPQVTPIRNTQQKLTGFKVSAVN